MSKAELRAKFIEAANAMAASQKGRFTLNDVYMFAKLTKRDFRQVFRNKSDLIEAASQANIAELNRDRANIADHEASEEKWIERRFRILERAMSSIETQLEVLRHGGRINARSPTTPAEQILSSIPDLAASASPTASPAFEPPPIVADLGSPSEPRTSSSVNTLDAADMPESNETSRENDGLESLWSIAEEPPEPRSYHTVVTIAVAIAFGIFLGILTSTVHGESAMDGDKKILADVDGGKPGIQDLRQANGSDTIAASKLAIAYAKGAGVEPDIGNAIRWAEVAASHGNADAEYLLGSMLQEGIKPDLSSAVKWYFKAASQGNIKAMHNLGIAFLMGTGVAKDSATAAQWFARAANLGYRDSEFDLAILYERGDGVPQNASIALRWYEQAAASGDVEAAKRASWLRENVTAVTTIQ